MCVKREGKMVRKKVLSGPKLKPKVKGRNTPSLILTSDGAFVTAPFTLLPCIA